MGRFELIFLLKPTTAPVCEIHTGAVAFVYFIDGLESAFKAVIPCRYRYRHFQGKSLYLLRRLPEFAAMHFSAVLH